MSPTKLSRRAKAGRLNTLENDRLFAVITVFEESLSLFKNDVIATTEWMSTPVRGLGSKSPLDMMRTRMETNVVIDPAGRPTGEGCSRVRSDRCVITSHLSI